MNMRHLECDLLLLGFHWDCYLQLKIWRITSHIVTHLNFSQASDI